jgi:hypothetical protein
MTEFKDRDPRLHDGSHTSKRPAHLPPPRVSPLHQAHKAADERLQVMQDHHAKHGQSLLLWAPDELMHKVESMAHVLLQNEWSGNTVDWASLMAVCLAGWCSAARAEEVRVDTGDDAA